MGKRSRALPVEVQARVNDALRIRLDGAEFWDLREFVREKEKDDGSAWHLGPGQNPLSDGQIRRYQQWADEVIEESGERSRRKLLRRHAAKRRNLYAKAVLTGDYRTALACLSDEAKLLGLYPAERAKYEHTGPKGRPIEAKVSHDIAELLPPADVVGALIRSALDAEADRALRRDGQAEPVDTPRPQ